ncbi:MAG: ribonucleotide-diphosphate reductase subunit beta [Herbaspirillum sp.]
MFFYVGLVYVLVLAYESKMVGTSGQCQYILRDDSMYCNSGIDLINTIKMGNLHL